jgi:hypothetical protein
MSLRPRRAYRRWLVHLATRAGSRRFRRCRGHPPGRKSPWEPEFQHYWTFSQLSSYICQCGNSPKCRHDHRLKQQPGWTVDQLPDGTFRWTTPAGRSYTTEPTRYPI